MSKFQKAVRSQSKLRAAMYGPSGSGKTRSALRIAQGIVEELGTGKIALIDSERGSASKYAGLFEFDVLNLEKKTIEEYSAAIDDANAEGYPVLIIDSLSHAWHELVGETERLAKAKFGGNTFAAWSVGTPKQKQFIEKMLSFPGHLIVTMRAKTEWVIEDKDGKKVPTRKGAGVEQGKGIEFEFDILMSISAEHVAIVEKDRTGIFQDQSIDRPSEQMGKDLVKWLNSGEAPPPPPPSAQTQEERLAKAEADVQKVANKVQDAAGDIEKLTAIHNWLLPREKYMPPELFQTANQMIQTAFQKAGVDTQSGEITTPAPAKEKVPA